MTKPISPIVSIIVPCFGVESYLDRCVHSLLNQTLTDIEIILVDDGSPDNVPQMCDEYAVKDSRIKVIHKENAGLGLARNSGLEMATGKYIAFVDSDDYVEVDMMAALVDFALQNDLQACFCGFYQESPTDKAWLKFQEVDRNTVIKDQHVTSLMLDMIASAHDVVKERKFYMSVWHAIYSREVIRRNSISFLSERNVGSEDLPFQIDFLISSHKIGYIKRPLYRYCANGTSLTATFRADKFDKYVNLYRLISKKTIDISGADERCARFLVGYARTELLQSISSGYSEQKKYFLSLVNNPIWDEIRLKYPLEHVSSLYQRAFYALILKKDYRLFKHFANTINILRVMRNRLHFRK